MTEEMYREIDEYFAANTEKKLNRARKQTALEIAKRCLENGISIDKVARCTKLSLDEVVSLQKELSQE